MFILNGRKLREVYHMINFGNIVTLSRDKLLQLMIRYIILSFRWYWQSAKFQPTPFQLHQLLCDPEPELIEDHPGVKVTCRKLTNYNKSYNFSLNGKIGGKLKFLLDAELDGEPIFHIIDL